MPASPENPPLLFSIQFDVGEKEKTLETIESQIIAGEKKILTKH